MAFALACGVWCLGIGHLVFGLFKFRQSLLSAVQAGFVGQFRLPEERRTAIWFFLFTPFLLLVGHVAIHAVQAADLSLLRIAGMYLLLAGSVGLAAMPKSPFLAGVVVAPMLIAAGYGLL